MKFDRLEEITGSGKKAANFWQKPEAERVQAVKDAGHVPEDCGDEAPVAPARGAVRAQNTQRLVAVGSDDYVSVPAGHLRRKTLHVADAFDVMAGSAARNGSGPAFTPTQVAMGRHYRALYERHASAGVKCSSLETATDGGGGQGSFIDAVLRDREELTKLHIRIGSQVSLQVRRVRPSARGSRVQITDRALVDAVCLHDKTISDVLRDHGWAKYGNTVKAAQAALAGALDRMAGPIHRPRAAVYHSI